MVVKLQMKGANVQNAFFTLACNITYNRNSECHYSLSDCFTMLKRISNKLTSLTVIYYYCFVCFVNA